MTITFIIVSVLLAALIGMAGITKLTGQPRMREAATHFGIPWERYRLIGVLEVLATAGLLIGTVWHPLGITAAVGIVLLMIGALAFHLRAGDRPPAWAGAAVTLVIAAVVIGFGLAI